MRVRFILCFVIFIYKAESSIYFTPPDKINHITMSPFVYMTPNNTPPIQKKTIDPSEKCVVESCYNRRMVLPTGEQLIVCSTECERKLRGFPSIVY